jgi:hypothetical protein
MYLLRSSFLLINNYFIYEHSEKVCLSNLFVRRSILFPIVVPASATPPTIMPKRCCYCGIHIRPPKQPYHATPHHLTHAAAWRATLSFPPCLSAKHVCKYHAAHTPIIRQTKESTQVSRKCATLDSRISDIRRMLLMLFNISCCTFATSCCYVVMS